MAFVSLTPSAFSSNVCSSFVITTHAAFAAFPFSNRHHVYTGGSWLWFRKKKSTKRSLNIYRRLIRRPIDSLHPFYLVLLSPLTCPRGFGPQTANGECPDDGWKTFPGLLPVSAWLRQEKEPSGQYIKRSEKMGRCVAQQPPHPASSAAQPPMCCRVYLYTGRVKGASVQEEGGWMKNGRENYIIYKTRANSSSSSMRTRGASETRAAVAIR